jgi:hypothetical protein
MSSNVSTPHSLRQQGISVNQLRILRPSAQNPQLKRKNGGSAEGDDPRCKRIEKEK